MTKTNRLWCLSTVLAMAACSTGHDDDPEPSGSPSDSTQSTSSAATKACEPFAGVESEIAIENPVVIARDEAGVIYVIDDPGDGELRVFISQGDELHRHRVLGSGAGKDGDELSYRVSVEAGEPLTLDARIHGDGTVEIVKLATLEDDKTSIEDGEPLEALAEDALEGLSIHNLEPEIEIEYFLAIDDGRFALVVRPRDDFRYEDFRVFLGEADAMHERVVESVLRARDGGTTHIAFALDQEPATLHLPSQLNMPPKPDVLEVNGSTFGVERIEDTAMAPDLDYYCLVSAGAR